MRRRPPGDYSTSCPVSAIEVRDFAVVTLSWQASAWSAMAGDSRSPMKNRTVVEGYASVASQADGSIESESRGSNGSEPSAVHGGHTRGPPLRLARSRNSPTP